MNNVSSTTSTLPDDELSLLDLLITLLRRKKAILLTTIAGAVLSVAISLALPNVYQATATLLPPQQQQSGAAAMLSQLSGLAGAAGGVPGIKNPSDLYIGMLKSRTIGDRIVDRFSLKKVYAVDSQELARARLAANTDITSGKDGLIVIQVEDRSQKLVPELANAYTNELLDLTKVLAVTEAGQRRVFYERQLNSAKDNLGKAEAALKGNLDTQGVMSMETEGKAVLETVARLRAQVSAKEIELNAMRPFVTPNHPDFQHVEQELASLRQELASLQNGRRDSQPVDGETASGKGGVQGLENFQRLRDLKYYQALYELLAKQYEIARLDEAKNPGVIQVLDPAVQPEHKFKPKRSQIVIGTTLAAFVLACIWMLMAEVAQRAALSPATSAQYEQLRKLLRLRG
jgi:tyrosine-protein kinase Etk/Wzc